MIKSFNKKLLAGALAVFVLSLFVVPVLVSAVEPDPVKVVNPIKVDTLNGFIKILLEGIIKIGIPLVAIALVYSGFMFVTAMGSPDKLKKAKDAFIYALLGAAILLGSWALANLIHATVVNIS